MVRETGLIFAALATLALLSPAHADMSRKDMNHLIDATNFLVNDICSGTLIDGYKGLILTANHCVQQQFQDVEKEELQKDGVVSKVKRRIAVPGSVAQLTFSGPNQTSKSSFTIRVKDHDPDHDLALVQTLGKLPNRDSFVAVSCTDVERGDSVWAVGNPYVVLYASLTHGNVASTHRDYRTLGIEGETEDDPMDQPGDNGLVQHTAPIFGGNSGGALLNDNGELVGVNVRGGLPTLSLSVPLSDIRKFLAKNDEAVCGDPKPKSIWDDTPSEDVE